MANKKYNNIKNIGKNQFPLYMNNLFYLFSIIKDYLKRNFWEII